jgi:uncharacterized membrane protein
MAMAAILTSEDAVRKARMHGFIVPREHGAWGLLLVPLFTGVAVGVTPSNQVWPVFLFTLASLSLFWLRTPLEALLGSGVIVAHSAEERRMALRVAVVSAVISVACLFALMWNRRNLQLILFGLIAAAALAAQFILRRLGRQTRMAAQLVGAIALTATAPAAYYLGTGHLGKRGLLLWLANWCFACNQIHFVQMCIHSTRAATLKEKFMKGSAFLWGQAVLFGALLLGTAFRWLPAFITLAFVPGLFRGALWFFRYQPLDVKKLGWSEMKQGVTFGSLLALAFIIS